MKIKGRGMFDFRGQVAVVTGGCSGIGLETVRALAQAGGAVIVLDRAQTWSDPQVLEGLEDKVTHLPLNVSDGAAVAAAFSDIGKTHSKIDILVNSAGIADRDTVGTLAPADWSRVLAVNLDGVFFCMQGALPLMRANGGGSIVNIASIAGKRISYSGGVAYTASKAGVLGLTRHAAFELAVENIRVNAVCPGPTLTPMIENTLSPQEREAAAGTIPLGHWITPAQIAESILFLASPLSAMITGSTIDVDGGVLVSNGQPYQRYFTSRGL